MAIDRGEMPMMCQAKRRVSPPSRFKLEVGHGGQEIDWEPPGGERSSQCQPLPHLPSQTFDGRPSQEPSEPPPDEQVPQSPEHVEQCSVPLHCVSPQTGPGADLQHE